MDKKLLLNKRKSHLSFWCWLVLIALSFCAFVSLASDSLNTIALYVVIPILFLFSLLKEGRLFSNKYEKILVFLYVWVLISSLWATYSEPANNELKSVLGAFLLTFVISVQAKNERMIPGLYVLFFLLYLGAWYYASQNLLIVTDFASEERINDAKLNANTLAYYTFFVTFAIFILSELFNNPFFKKFLRIVFIAFIPFSLFVALATASRQVLLIQIPFFSLLLWMRYVNRIGRSKRVAFISITLIAIAYFAPRVENILQDSYLMERSQVSVQDDSRIFLMKDAMRVGMEHFPLGVGAGNYQKYSPRGYFSHNTFTELFANTGIVGFLLFAYLMAIFVIRQWSRYKKTKDRMYAYYLIFGLFYIIDQFFFVFYTHLWLMSFFMLVASHSETYYKSSKTI
jgi:O-antigen ligase